MIKKTITYTDYNGDKQTRDFYFNLNKVECMELEYGLGPGTSLTSSIQTIIDNKDMGTIIRTIKNIVLTAYGQKSPDGNRFVKTEESREAFEQSPAFEAIYWELINDIDKSADFIAGIMPGELRDKLGSDPAKALIEETKTMTLIN